MTGAGNGQLAVTAEMVARLLGEQCPELIGGRVLSSFRQGWDNTVFALGDDLLVRVPHHAIGGELALAEHRVLPGVAAVFAAAGVAVGAPVPVFVGMPSAAYPWRFSVVPWLPGTVAFDVPAQRRAEEARLLARALVALHRRGDAAAAPVNSYRTGHIGDRPPPDWVAAREAIEDAECDAADLEAAWSRWAGAPAWDRDPVAIHADVHAGNILVGPLALIDWGDSTAGDPAVDLSAAWTVFEGDGTAAFVDEATRLGGYDADTWARARAWALRHAVLVAGGPDTALRRESPRVLRALLAYPPSRTTRSAQALPFPAIA